MIQRKRRQEREEQEKLDSPKPSSSVKPAVRRRKSTGALYWNDMTDAERRQQIRERDEKLAKDYNEAKRKLKSTARRGGILLKHMTKDAVAAGKVAVKGLGEMADNYEKNQRAIDRRNAAKDKRKVKARKAAPKRKLVAVRHPARHSADDMSYVYVAVPKKRKAKKKVVVKKQRSYF